MKSAASVWLRAGVGSFFFFIFFFFNKADSGQARESGSQSTAERTC